MKVKFLIPFLMLFTFISCSSSPTPKETAKKLLDDLNEKKMENVMAMSTPEMQKAFSALAASITAKNMEETFQYEILDERTAGDLATVKVKMTEKGKPDQTIHVKMIRKDGKWLVSGMGD